MSIEALLKRYDKTFAFCDTDSMAVPPEFAERLEKFFEPLTPYSFKNSILEQRRKNQRAYCICPKRYALHQKEGDKIFIEKEGDYKLSGLTFEKPQGAGNDWKKEFWIDGLKIEYGQATIEEMQQKYRNSRSIRIMNITNWQIYKSFINMNNGRPLTKQIKPANRLINCGSTDKNVKIIAAAINNPKTAVHKEFINYRTGEVMKGEHYWKRLDQTFFEYFNRPENKLDGEKGILQRKHLNLDRIIHIGKESKDIEYTGMLHGQEYTIYENEEEFKQALLAITNQERIIAQIPKATLSDARNKSAKGQPFHLSNKTIRKLQEFIRHKNQPTTNNSTSLT